MTKINLKAFFHFCNLFNISQKQKTCWFFRDQTPPGGNTHWLGVNNIRSNVVLGQRPDAHTHLVWFRGDGGSWQCRRSIRAGVNTVSGVVDGLCHDVILETGEICSATWAFLPELSWHGGFQHCWTCFTLLNVCLLCIVFIDPICTCFCKLFSNNVMVFSAVVANIPPTSGCQRKQTTVKK